jgi:hypothetical protein
MTTIMPESELLRRAVRWLSEQLEDEPKDIHTLVQEASMRFNLGPKDEELLVEFFRKNIKKQDDSPA